MKSEIKIFEKDGIGQVRAVEIDGVPLFVANDIAKSLGYKIPKDAISQHCRKAVKHLLPCKSGSYTNKDGKVIDIIKDTTLNVIPESDVYRLIMRSNLPDSEKFQDWVCDEVLPAIRRNGAYISENITEEQDQYRHENAVLEMLRNKKKIGKRLMKIWENLTPHQIKLSAMYILDNVPAGCKKQDVFDSINGVTKQLEQDYRNPAKNDDYDPNVSVQFRSDLFYPITEALNKFNNRSHGQTIRHMKTQVEVPADWKEKCRVPVPVKVSCKPGTPDRRVSFGVCKLYMHYSVFTTDGDGTSITIAEGYNYRKLGTITGKNDFIDIGGLRLKYDFVKHEAIVLHKE